MFRAFSLTIDILKKSWRAIMADRELLVFPILGFIAVVVELAIFGLLGFLAFTLLNGTPMIVATAIVIIGLYITITFTLIFANSALTAGVLQRIRGGDPTLGSAFGAAKKRAWNIFLWSLIAATVSLLLNAAREQARKGGGVGAIIALLGLGVLATVWELITFFVVPILVAEGLGPIASLKRSLTIFKSTWGTSVVGNFAFGIFYFLAALPGVAIGAALYFLNPIVGIVVGGIIAVLASGFIYVLTSVFRAVLYNHAVNKLGTPATATPTPIIDAPPADSTAKGKGYSVFKPDFLDNAYRPKKT